MRNLVTVASIEPKPRRAAEAEAVLTNALALISYLRLLTAVSTQVQGTAGRLMIRNSALCNDISAHPYACK